MTRWLRLMRRGLPASAAMVPSPLRYINNFAGTNYLTGQDECKSDGCSALIHLTFSTREDHHENL